MTDDKSHTPAAAEFAMTDDCRVGCGSTVPLAPVNILPYMRANILLFWQKMSEEYYSSHKDSPPDPMINSGSLPQRSREAASARRFWVFYITYHGLLQVKVHTE